MTSAAQQDKLFDDICSQNQNFEHFEKSFQEVLMDLENDDVLAAFRLAYENLHNSFLKCHEGERRLIKKCQDLTAEINSCQLKVKSAEDLSGEDKKTIKKLDEEIVKTKEKINQSKETEITLKEKIKQLKVDIKELDKQVQRGAEGVVGHDTTLQELGRVRMDLQKEHDTQKAQLNSIQHDINHLKGRLGKVQNEKAIQDKELADLNASIEKKRTEVDEQRERKDTKDREMKGLKEALSTLNNTVETNNTQSKNMNDNLDKLQKKVNTEMEASEARKAELQKLLLKIEQVKATLADLMEYNSQLARQIQVQEQQLQIKQNESANIHKDRMKQQQVLDSINKRNAAVESAKNQTESERNSLSLQLQQKELDLASLNRQAENDRKQIEDLTRERDILNKNYLKAQSATKKQEDWVMVKKNQERNLNHQINGYDRHLAQQEQIIHQLEKEAEQYENEAIEARRRVQNILEDIKAKENLIVEEQDNIKSREANLKSKQNSLATVIQERDMYTKQLRDLNNEISEMRRKFKINIGQIKQLKAEISFKDDQVLKEDTEVHNLTQSKQDYEIAIDADRKKTERKQKIIEAHNKELHKLNQIIADADAEKSRQKRDHINVMNERDILGAQLIRRNDELAKLYEKIRIQQSSLRKGESQYNCRLRDIQHLNLRVTTLDHELQLMRDFASRLPDLKLLVNKTNRELTREQCRVRNLLDECDNPLNLHRFTMLECSEPQSAQIIDRVRKLQRQLIDKSNEVEQKDKLIAEKEKLYVELKSIIARQPGPEVAEQLNVYQDNLQKKTGQMKAMKASLKHFQEQVEHYKSQHEELTQELTEMNQGYVVSVKRSRKDQQRQRALNEMMGRPVDAPASGTDGGGGGDNVYVGYTAPPRPETSESTGGGPGLDLHDGSEIPQLASPDPNDQGGGASPSANATSENVDIDGGSAEPTTQQQQQQPQEGEENRTAETTTTTTSAQHEEEEAPAAPTDSSAKDDATASAPAVDEATARVAQGQGAEAPTPAEQGTEIAAATLEDGAPQQDQQQQ